MTVELVPRLDADKVAPVAPPTVPKPVVQVCELVRHGDIEVVTTATGTILFVPQSLDE